MTPKWVTSLVDALRSIINVPIVAFIDTLKLLLKIPAVWVDGTLYVSIAVFGVLQTVFSSDEAKQFIDPEKLFWVKTSVVVIGNAALSLKMFRSNSAPPPRTQEPANPDPGEGVTKFLANPNPPSPEKTP